MAKTIPEIRDALNKLAVEKDMPILAALAEATKRRFFGRVAPAKARPITRETCKAVRAFAKHKPKMHQRDIGRHFGIDGGRVNEILRGMRNGQTYEEYHHL